VATFRVRPENGGVGGASDAAAGATFTLINNHFTSKLQGERGAERRRDQAAWVAKLASGAEAVTSLNPDRVMVLGDLNTEIGEDAYVALVGEASGAPSQTRLTNLALRLPISDQYSWRDGTRRLLLDHVLVSQPLDAATRGVEILHINSEASPRLSDVGGTYERSSDHDPVVVTLAS
jgi:predicted extracellular nuclease